ncbi:MAG: hypothetical protein AAF658_04855 [Myxococcota bacterium]
MTEETRRKSRSEVEMEVRLEQLDPESSRYRVLLAARDFKASWIALGEKLTRVRESNAFTEWGYSDFETYCRRELHIKRDTANKLTRSYAFLRDHQPAALEQPPVARELPPLDVVDLLTRARERAKVSDEQFEEIRRDVFSEDQPPPTRAAVVKRFREVDPDAFRTPQKPKAKPGEGGPAEVKKALLLAERLESVLESLSVTEQTRASLTLVVGELRHLFQHENPAPLKKSA